ncbi:unnamed protein product, partial [Mesorhabditis belari]|uniref:Uncharacterized protein n=1 Tax=Mesorhabditis belari TaxID=2138241 RepID=A0AAF3FLF3_9BILA
MQEAATITTSSLVDTSSVEIAAQKALNLQRPPLVCSEQGPNTRRHLAAAFQTSSGSVPSPICSANRLLTTPAMLGLSKTPHAFHARELVTPRSAVPYEKVGLSSGMRIVEERRVLTDRRPKSKKQNGSRGQNSDDYMDGIG